MARIFISYRRSDSAGHTGRLYDKLAAEFGDHEVYRDLDKRKFGTRFDERITSELAGCDAFLAVMGRRWASVEDEHGQRRLDDPQDRVRWEISAALERKIPIFPVLVDGARMPAAGELPADLVDLRLHESLELSESRWGYDVGLLVDAVREALMAEELAPHCRTVAQRLAEGRVVPVIGTRGRSGLLAQLAYPGSETSAWSSIDWFSRGDRVHAVLAAVPEILRRKGYDSRLLIATSETDDALESAFQAADEEYELADDRQEPTDWTASPSVGREYPVLSWAAGADPVAPRPRTTIYKLRAPSPLSERPRAEAALRAIWGGVDPDVHARLGTSDLLFLGGSEDDPAVASLVRRRGPLATSEAWVVGVKTLAGTFWTEHGVELVEAELPAYGRALKRQVEALPPVD